MSKICIVTASHIPQVLKENLLASKITNHYPVETRLGYKNIPMAYNTAERGEEFTIFVHHDVFMPIDFEDQLLNAMSKLPNDWAVCGVAGARMVGARTLVGHLNDRGREWGKPIDMPIRVETLDELILIVNSKYDLKFDENFTQDFYGADICMQANQQHLKCFVLPAYLHHNSSRAFGGRTPSFFDSEAKFASKWRNWLPLATTCSVIYKPN